mmetsp:Transcript_28746/g.93912  ORF Transcript_28746/g.93912 Transcript_28746/m.93912 type:complete len:207 (-) Transcript_28746:2186-2806(-)
MAEKQSVELLRVKVASDNHLHFFRAELIRNHLTHAVERERGDGLLVWVREAAVPAEQTAHHAVHGCALERLVQRAVVRQVQLLGAHERGVLPSRLLHHEVDELEHPSQSPAVHRKVEIHRDELLVRFQDAVDELAETEHLHLPAFPVAHSAALGERPRSDRHRARALARLDVGLRRLPCAPSLNDDSQHRRLRLIVRHAVVDAHAV